MNNTILNTWNVEDYHQKRIIKPPLKINSSIQELKLS